MTKASIHGLKQISSPFSTGGGGSNFERHVQAVFLLSLLVDGFTPVLGYEISELCFQTRALGYHTDDLLVISSHSAGKQKLLCQIKSVIAITEKDADFQHVISAAWCDYNSDSFDKKLDRIALITETVAKSSMKSMRTIHTQATSSRDTNDFLRRIRQSNICNETDRKKLEVLRGCLTKAKGAELSDEELFGFCKVFIVVLFDGSYDNGIQEALCTSLIHCKSQKDPQLVWEALSEYAGQCNESAKSVTRDSVSPHILELFGLPEPKLSLDTLVPSEELANAFMIGAWDENNENDKALIETMTGSSYGFFLKFARKQLEAGNPLFSLTDGIWRVSFRKSNWNSVKDYYYDDTIKRAFTAFSGVMLEDSKEFSSDNELPITPATGWFTNSNSLRNGLCQGLCLLVNAPEPKHSSSGLIKQEASRLIRALFDNGTWKTLAGLQELLPIIAEMSPSFFVRELELFSYHNKVEIQKLFPKIEQNILLFRNHISHILRALERLAWIPDCFVACIRCLGIMESIDHDTTNFCNTPLNSIVSILNAFHVQTYASIELIESALKALQNDSPELCWKVISSLLPISSFCVPELQKPEFINFTEWESSLPNKDSQALLRLYVGVALQLASKSSERLADLSSHIKYMDRSSRLSYLGNIIANSTQWNDQEKFPVWNNLCNLIDGDVIQNENKGPSTETFSLLKKAIHVTTPENKWYRYLRLFSNSNDCLQYGADGIEKRKAEQKSAVLDLYSENGIESVLSLGNHAGKIREVGTQLGAALDRAQINAVLQQYSQDPDSEFYKSIIEGYIDQTEIGELLKIGLDEYAVAFRAKVLLSVRFSPEILPLVDKILPDKTMYWKEVSIGYIWPDWPETTIVNIVNALTEVERYDSIINSIGLYVDQCSLPNGLLQTVMLGAITKQSLNNLHPESVCNIIHRMQNDSHPNIEVLARIEYAFLPYFDTHSEVTPKALHCILANDSNHFCHFMKKVYKPLHEKGTSAPLSAGESQRLFILLYCFPVVPGVNWDGNFVDDAFKLWLEQTLNWAIETDREEAVKHAIGNGLSHAAKTNGLPNDTILKVLDDPQNQEMRHGYQLGIENQRGAHFVDPEGKRETSLSKEYQSYAKTANSKGFSRFADTMLAIAEDYAHEAQENKKRLDQRRKTQLSVNSECGSAALTQEQH